MVHLVAENGRMAPDGRHPLRGCPGGRQRDDLRDLEQQLALRGRRCGVVPQQRQQRKHSNVKITVSVPKSVKVGAHSVNGGVSVRDVGAEVRATTVNGGVIVRMQQALFGRTP